MATSGSTDFTVTAQDIIEDALRLLNVIRQDQDVEPGDTDLLLRSLNRMVKSWQSQGIHLWKRAVTLTLFLGKGDREISVGPNRSHVATAYNLDFLVGEYAAGASQIILNNSAVAAVGEHILVAQDDGVLHTTTISNIVNPTTFDLTTPLSGAASDGNIVYIHTGTGYKPFNILDAIRSTRFFEAPGFEGFAQTDIPMFQMSYQEYFDQPNKSSEGTPVNYMYDRQIPDPVIYLWPAPANTDYVVKLSVIKKIEDFDSVANTPDFPQEWEDTLVYNLAVRVAPAFGKASDPNFAQIKEIARETLISSLAFDSEQGSLKLQPDFER